MPAIRAPMITIGSELAVMITTKARQRRASATTAQVRQPMRSTNAPSSGPRTIAGSSSGSSTAVTAHGVSKRS